MKIEELQMTIAEQEVKLLMYRYKKANKEVQQRGIELNHVERDVAFK